MLTLRTIDAHAGGAPVRLVVEGFPAARGRTMLEKREWLGRHADHLRRALMLEPRGHGDMCGAVLTEPTSPGSHAGIVFMHAGGFGTLSGHGIIAATTIALERGLVMPGGSGAAVVFDTPAGPVRARATIRTPDGRQPQAAVAGVERVSFLNVPSFVLEGGLAITVRNRPIRADVAFGGAFHAIVDAEAVGLSLDRARVPELRRAGIEIAAAIEAARTIAHPLEPALSGIQGVVFTAPPTDPRADLRNVAVIVDGCVDRSPSGSATAAVMAVLDAMGLLADDTPFVHESLIGTTFSGRCAGRTMVGELPAITVEIEGEAWITGEHTFLIDERDPLREGFRV